MIKRGSHRVQRAGKGPHLCGHFPQDRRCTAPRDSGEHSQTGLPVTLRAGALSPLGLRDPPLPGADLPEMRAGGAHLGLQASDSTSLVSSCS